MKTVLFSLAFILSLQFAAAQQRYRGTKTQYKPKQTAYYTVPDTNMLSLAKAVYQVVNDYRQSVGLSKLKMQRELNDIAFEHSYRMASGKIAFSHQDFHERVKMVDKYANISYRTAENLYAHQIAPNKFAKEALKGWLGSPGHKKNMDGAFIHTGLGVCRSKTGELFVTQIFVGKASYLIAGTKGIEELDALDTGQISPTPTATE